MPKLAPLQGGCVLAFRHDGFLIFSLCLCERYKNALVSLCLLASSFLIMAVSKLSVLFYTSVVFLTTKILLYFYKLRINFRQDNKLMIVVSTFPFSIRISALSQSSC